MMKIFQQLPGSELLEYVIRHFLILCSSVSAQNLWDSTFSFMVDCEIMHSQNI